MFEVCPREVDLRRLLWKKKKNVATAKWANEGDFEEDVATVNRARERDFQENVATAKRTNEGDFEKKNRSHRLQKYSLNAKDSILSSDFCHDTSGVAKWTLVSCLPPSWAAGRVGGHQEFERAWEGRERRVREREGEDKRGRQRRR